MLNDGSDLDRLYKQNAERILLQSAAASTMSAHLAAAALGYAVWRKKTLRTQRHKAMYRDGSKVD